MSPMTAGGYPADGTSFYPDPSQPIAQPYSLRCLSAVQGTQIPVQTTDRSRGDPVRLVAAPIRIEETSRAISVVTRTMSGEITDRADGSWAPCVTGTPGHAGELLVWTPSIWYETATDTVNQDKKLLFLYNYAREPRIIHRDALVRALDAASSWRQLHSSSRLEFLGRSGAVSGSIPLDPRYRPEMSVGFVTQDGGLAVVRTDGGHQDVDDFYLLVDQPRVLGDPPYAGRVMRELAGSFRGFFAVDLTADEIAWVCGTGPRAGPWAMTDLNSDGREEFIVGTYSPENGANGCGTTDRQSAYVLCLDRSGERLWSRRFLGPYLGVQAGVAELDEASDGPEMVAVCSSSRHEGIGTVALLTNGGETVTERSDLGGLLGLVIAEVGEGAACRIATSAPHGRLLLLDEKLEVAASFADTAHAALLSKRLIPLAASDLDGDGALEIVALSTGWTDGPWSPRGREMRWDRRSYLVILSASLEEEARVLIPAVDESGRCPRARPASVTATALVDDLNGDGRSEIVLTSIGIGYYIFGLRSADAAS